MGLPGSRGAAELAASLQVKQYRKLLLEQCLGSLRGPVSSSVTAEGMETLTKILAELREGDMGSSFEAISELCRVFFDNVSPDESLPRYLRIFLLLKQNAQARVIHKA